MLSQAELWRDPPKKLKGLKLEEKKQTVRQDFIRMKTLNFANGEHAKQVSLPPLQMCLSFQNWFNSVTAAGCHLLRS